MTLFISQSVLVILLILGILAGVRFLQRESSRKYGSSQFLFFLRGIISSKNKGLLVDGRKKRLKKSLSFKHLCLIAPSGSGKSQAICAPEILTCSRDTILITDIKGEMLEITSAHLQSKGYEIVTLDLKNSNTIHFNPLKRLKSEESIRKFAEQLASMTEKGGKKSGSLSAFCTDSRMENLRTFRMYYSSLIK